jgi:hypothetical protein
MNNTEFWDVIRTQLNELRTAVTADDVLSVLSNERNPNPTMSAGDGFFAGSGGDDTVRGALREAGWRTTWAEANYFYAMQSPDGSTITYIEGDIYRGDQRVHHG